MVVRRHHIRNRKPSGIAKIIFATALIIAAGSLLYATAHYVCVSPLECEQLKTTAAIFGLSAALFLLAFKGPIILQQGKTKLISHLSTAEQLEAYKKRKEVEDIIRQCEKLLVTEIYTAQVLYTTIQPIYNTLPPRQKKKVISKIRLLHKKLSQPERER